MQVQTGDVKMQSISETLSGLLVQLYLPHYYFFLDSCDLEPMFTHCAKSLKCFWVLILLMNFTIALDKRIL